MRRSSSGVLGVLAIAVAIVVAGCGGGSKPSASSSTSSTSTAYASSSTSTAVASGAAVITTKSNPVLGTTILAAGPKKLTVYMFAADHGGTSTCYGACAGAWPPLTTTGAPKAEGGASAAKLGTITRSEGTKQVTYGGYPLYYYSPDTTEASISGQGISSFGALWWVLSPAGKIVTKS
jgi:predicted lipoprotein with Yx(FWY)xxD motif